MIKFEQIPPQSPEDVNFTSLPDFEMSGTPELGAIGETIGSVILANCGDKPDRQLLNGIYEHLVSSVPYGPRTYTNAFKQGLHYKMHGYSIGVENV